MPNEVPQPIEPAPQPPAKPASTPVAVQIVDQLGDMVGVIAIALLCYAGKVSGEVAIITICALLGVQSGVRRIGAAKTTAGLGALGILVMGAISLGAGDRAHQVADAARNIGGQ